MKKNRFEWYNELCFLNEKRIELNKRYRQSTNEYDKSKIENDQQLIYERITELRQRLQATK